MKKIITMMALALVSVFSSYAQERDCAVIDNLEYRKQQDPTLETRMQQIEAYTQQKAAELDQNRSVENGIISLPVVVHILYTNSTNNISAAQIQSQIDVLNEDFRRTNSDADNTWSQADDMQIQFCMATVDPSGNATNAITRKSVTRTDWGTNDDMKRASQGGVNPWDTSQYLNMWIVPKMTSGGRTILGYAQFPGGSAATDGVVMGYNYFGRIGAAQAPFDLGRTTTHEVGHFLNLRHIWGDGNCSADDFVTDTPTSDAANYGCTPTHVSCNSTDMVQNYMDYSDDSCMNLFTTGQKNRMRATLLSGGFRAALGASTKCGGTTPPGPTCTDGVQNGDETGVDCGGSACNPCQTACSDNDVNVSITFDNYPEETAWTITNDAGQTVASGGTYGSQADGSTFTEDFCLVDGCYTFTITDVYGDGICCSYGNGSYTVTGPDGSLASGGSFTSSDATAFCLGNTPPAPTCDDGLQNGDETGIDCGGSSCAPCSTGGGGDVVLNEGYFETGLDGWVDGGSDCYRYSGSRSYEGSRSMRIRDNSGTASAMTLSNIDTRGYSAVEINFYFYANSMENGEDFWVRYYNGSSWSTVATYARGTNFNNGTFYSATVTLNPSQYNFAANSGFRFQNDASGNNDQIYIDQVTITGLGSGSRTDGYNDGIIPIRDHESADGFDSEEDFVIYPNPVTGGVLNVAFRADLEASFILRNILGQEMNSGVLKDSIDVTNLASGVYFLEVNDGEETMVKKFIIK